MTVEQHPDLLWDLEFLNPEQRKAYLERRLVQLQKLRVDTENKMAACHSLLKDEKEARHNEQLQRQVWAGLRQDAT